MSNGEGGKKRMEVGKVSLVSSRLRRSSLKLINISLLRNTLARNGQTFSDGLRAR